MPRVGGGVLDARNTQHTQNIKEHPCNYNNSEFARLRSVRQLPDSDRPEIVFSGPLQRRQNSTFINKLCNRKKLARVSATPGKTATINFYRVDTAYFVDLPGYGYAKVSNAERERWDD